VATLWKTEAIRYSRVMARWIVAMAWKAEAIRYGVGVMALAAVVACVGGGSGDGSPSASAPASSPTAAATGTPLGPGLGASFSFAAAGDHGADDDAELSLRALDASGAAFYLALGDMDYNETDSDAGWCQFVRDRLPKLGDAFPFQLVSGNHEDDGSQDGSILNHARCLPDRLGSTGTYAAQYYFDYPATKPLLRVIMIAPDLKVGGVEYDYAEGTSEAAWLNSAINDARSGNIPWVVVGMHKNCITMGNKECEIGEELLNLLVEKRVDLVLQGHDHNYQRSKQLALSAGGCPAITADSYESRCVADDGSDQRYAKGAGTVIVISGSFGRCCYPVDSDDTEAGYFAVSNGDSTGFTRYEVAADHIDAQFVHSTGDFADRFVIER